MQHLSPEDLARLADEPAEGGESLHLEVCADCRGELEALRRQSRALRSLPALAAPAGGWEALEARLEAEGLLAGPPAPRRRLRLPPLLRLAAALALFVAGGVSGAALWEARPADAPLATGAAPDDAAEALRLAEERYLAALTRYAEASGAADAGDPVNRLAALEGIVLTARAALQDAPADPVINGYLLNALGQREAILRRISDTPSEAWF